MEGTLGERSDGSIAHAVGDFLFAQDKRRTQKVGIGDANRVTAATVLTRRLLCHLYANTLSCECALGSHCHGDRAEE